jgi:hypothetical protein
MRVTFPRLPDHERAYALVQRDDGVVYQLYDGPAGPQLPHDIRHFVAERELRIPDGIWGGIAAGLVFTTMRYVSGRRLPCAGQRPEELLADFRARGLRAETLADLVERVALLDHPSQRQIRRLVAARLSGWPEMTADPAAVAAAAVALQVEASRWARLRVGQELSYDWPRPPRPVRRIRAGKPAAVLPINRRNQRRPAARLGAGRGCPGLLAARGLTIADRLGQS